MAPSMDQIDIEVHLRGQTCEIPQRRGSVPELPMRRSRNPIAMKHALWRENRTAPAVDDLSNATDCDEAFHRGPRRSSGLKNGSARPRRAMARPKSKPSRTIAFRGVCTPGTEPRGTVPTDEIAKRGQGRAWGRPNPKPPREARARPVKGSCSTRAGVGPTSHEESRSGQPRDPVEHRVADRRGRASDGRRPVHT
jgi:hypothetical protein